MQSWSIIQAKSVLVDNDGDKIEMRGLKESIILFHSLSSSKHGTIWQTDTAPASVGINWGLTPHQLFSQQISISPTLSSKHEIRRDISVNRIQYFVKKLICQKKIACILELWSTFTMQVVRKICSLWMMLGWGDLRVVILDSDWLRSRDLVTSLWLADSSWGQANKMKDNTGLWLAESDPLTWVPASDWLRAIIWLGYQPLIGW